MKVFDKQNIINYWDEIISKEDYIKLYRQIRKEVLDDLFKEHFSKMIGKEYGDLDKERRFDVLTKTKMPAILTENFFMDNFEEFRDILNTREGRQRIIDFHVKAIIQVKVEIFKESAPLNFKP